MFGFKITDRDLGWSKLDARLNRTQETAFVEVGILGDQSARNVMIGAVHEFGAPGRGIPQRSFIRATIDAKATALGNMAAKLSKRVLNPDDTMERSLALALMGEFLKAEIVKRINRNIKPSLKRATIKRKGSSVALVDTGRLKNSITYRVVGK